MYAKQIASIITDIAFNNPKSIPICCAIISKLFDKMDEPTSIKKLIYNKLINMPNSGFAQIWMQRMFKSEFESLSFSEKMCALYNGNSALWNNTWINSCATMMLDAINTPIFQQDEFDRLDNTISNDEVDIFVY